MKRLIPILSLTVLQAMPSVAWANCEPMNKNAERVAKIAKVGERSYKTTDGYVLYEGSLYLSLINVALADGLEGILPKLNYDVHLSKGMTIKANNLDEFSDEVTKRLKDINIYVDGNVIVIEDSNLKLPLNTPSPTFSSITPQSNEQSCESGNIFVFSVKPGSLEMNVANFEKLSGWSFEWESGSESYKSMVMSNATITGSSYYEILARLLANTGIGAVYE